PKTLPEARAWMLQRLKARIHPMNSLPANEGMAWVAELPGLDDDIWGNYWGGLGDRVCKDAMAAQERGDKAAAQELFLKASGLYFMGRFPSPAGQEKTRCATRERETYLAAAQYWDSPVERVVISFDGRQGEGDEVVVLVRRPVG